jgi:hypothetical protein
VAAREKHIEMIQRLRRLIDPPTMSSMLAAVNLANLTPLAIAVYECSFDCFLELIDMGADPLWVDMDGNSLLISCVEWKNVYEWSRVVAREQMIDYLINTIGLETDAFNLNHVSY